MTKPPQMPVAESGQGSEGERGFPGGQAGEKPGVNSPEGQPRRQRALVVPNPTPHLPKARPEIGQPVSKPQQNPA